MVNEWKSLVCRAFVALGAAVASIAIPETGNVEAAKGDPLFSRSEAETLAKQRLWDDDGKYLGVELYTAPPDGFIRHDDKSGAHIGKWSKNGKNFTLKVALVGGPLSDHDGQVVGVEGYKIFDSRGEALRFRSRVTDALADKFQVDSAASGQARFWIFKPYEAWVADASHGVESNGRYAISQHLWSVRVAYRSSRGNEHSVRISYYTEAVSNLTEAKGSFDQRELLEDYGL